MAGSSTDRTNSRPLVETTDLHKRFGSLVVLDGVDLTVSEGETLVVIGESGTGKSVLLKHIVGLLRPDQGAVCFGGQRIDDLSEFDLAPIRQQFGFLFQLSALFDSLTVAENVAFPLIEHRRASRPEALKIAREKLALVGLADDEMSRKYPSQISGGQKKRVALARAISMEPRVILYDEPTTGLDPPRSDVINELIIKLKREMCVASIVVTHDMHSCNRVADRIMMLRRGKFIFKGTPEEIASVEDPYVRDFVEGRAHREDLEALRIKGNKT